MDLKPVLEKVMAILDAAVKPAIELEVKKQIAAESDKYVLLVLSKLKAVIPGPFDDIVIDANLEKIKAMVKAELNSAADKISDKV